MKRKSRLAVDGRKKKHNSEPRLGIIISMFPELHETFILRELVALEGQGVRFDVFSLQFPRDPITLDDAVRLSTQRTTYSGLLTTATLAALLRTACCRPLRLLKAVCQVVVQGRDRPMDVVKNLGILPLSLLIGERGRQRGITHWHGHWANIPTTSCWYLGQIYQQTWSAAIHGEDIFSSNRFLRHKLNDALFSVVCSGYFCQHMKTHLGLDKPDKVHLNYHGLDPRVTQRQTRVLRPERRPDAHLMLVSVGRLVPTKGHDVLIKACGELKRAGIAFVLQLIGSGPQAQVLQSLAIAEGVDEFVIFRGALPFEDVLLNLEQADIFVLAPRLIAGHPPDGIPNVIAEAMALGVPVVTTRVSAIPELVTDQETGCLVDVDDVAGFSKAIALLATDRCLARKLSVAARQRVAFLFDQTSNIRELLELFAHYVPTGFVADGNGRQ